MLRFLSVLTALSLPLSALANGTDDEPVEAAKKGGGGEKKGKKKKADGVGPFAKKDYPMQERLRPLVLPDTMGEVGLDLTYLTFAGADAAATAPSFAYGIADVVEIGLSSTLLLAPDVDWGKDINLRGHYLAYDSKELDFAPGLNVPLILADGAGFGATIDLSTRYVLNEVVYFYFGQGAIPVLFSPDFALSVQASGGAGFQVDKSLVFMVDTTPFVLRLTPDTDVSGIWDVLTLNATGQYSWDRNGDVGVRLGITKIWEFDPTAFSATLYGRYRF